jgi:hypothetical protein
VTGRRDDDRDPSFNSTDLDRPATLLRSLAAVAVLIAVTIVMRPVLPVDIDVAVAMPVSLTTPNVHAANPDIDVFCDDHRVVTGVH